MSPAMIELLILVAIAGFVLYRLKSVIGTRTGHEAPPEYLSRDRAGQPAQPDAEAVILRPGAEPDPDGALIASLPEGAREAVQRIREVEPDFTLEEFLEGARAAYEMILIAYQEGDRATLKPLLTRDVMAAFDAVIADREAKGLTVEARFIGVRDARVLSAQIDAANGEADVTLKLVGELVTSVRDRENRVVEGDPNEIRRQTDVWTFSRKLGARDPNWLLSATGD